MMLLKMVFILGLASISLCQAPPCYVRCKENSCESTNLLFCNDCDPGSIVVDGKCLPVGGQTKPQEFLKPITQNDIINDFSSTYPEQVRCQYNNEGNLTFVNTTISKTDTYVFDTIFVPLPNQHNYIQVKFNAILFNQNSNPQIRVNIIDENDNDLFFDPIEPQASAQSLSLACFKVQEGNNSTQVAPQSSSPPIDVRLDFSSKSSFIFIQGGTSVRGDELGISSFEIYSGNCDPRCATCRGPTQKQCETCSGLLVKDKDTDLCTQCPTDFTVVEQICLSCPPSCKDCTYNPEKSQIQCDTCDEDFTSGSGQICQQNKLFYYEASFAQFTQDNYVIQTSRNEIVGNDQQFEWRSSVVSEGVITLCGPFSLIGGISVGVGGSTISKTFTKLYAHQTISIKFTLFMIDQITNSQYSYNLIVDGQTFSGSIEIDQTLQNSNTCAGDQIQFVAKIKQLDIPHRSSNVTIEIQGLSPFFGFRDFFLMVNNLTDQPNCLFADQNGTCQTCDLGRDAQQNCQKCPPGQALETVNVFQTLASCVPCSILCRTCSQSSFVNPFHQCDSCDPPLTYDADLSQCIDKENTVYTAEISPYTNTITNNNWVFYPKLQDRGQTKCNNQQILGSTILQYRNLTATRTIRDLPPHNGLIIYFMFYQIDDYDGINNDKNDYTVSFKINGKQAQNYNVSKSGFDICGNSTYDSKKKVVLQDKSHTSNQLVFEIFANRVKFGINLFVVFLQNCPDCDNGVSHELQLMPIYSIQNSSDAGMSAKILFGSPVSVIQNTQFFTLQSLYSIQFGDKKYILKQEQQNGRGQIQQRPQLEYSSAQLFKNRQLRLFRTLDQAKIDQAVIAKVFSTDKAFSIIPEEDRIKPLKNTPIKEEFPRYDQINEDETDDRINIRNLRNFFRGISILAMFIGLISFFFGLSHLFDDLFILCQVIFAHIFIQSAWLPATFKVPLSGMHLVQFMAWLPQQAREQIENAIYDREDYYQRSPIVYEQYWVDINFLRAIYHTLIFLAAMVALYMIIRLIRAIVRPRLLEIMESDKNPPKAFERHYFSLIKRKFAYMDRIVRFTFFTVVWAANLQFIQFKSQPTSINVVSGILCILLFVLYILFAILGQIHFFRQRSTLNDATFFDKFKAIRIRKERALYYAWQYLKLLIIATLIAQLYKSNPLAVLIPLMLVHIADAVIIAIFKPYLKGSQEEKILSKCTKIYWKAYWITFIVQNVLFAILEIIIMVMYGQRDSADTETYFGTGYAACVFVILLLVNGLIRLGWGMISTVEGCIDDVHKDEQAIKSEDDVKPLAALMQFRGAQADEINQEQNFLRPDERRPSIERRV